MTGPITVRKIVKKKGNHFLIELTQEDIDKLGITDEDKVEVTLEKLVEVPESQIPKVPDDISSYKS